MLLAVPPRLGPARRSRSPRGLEWWRRRPGSRRKTVWQVARRSYPDRDALTALESGTRWPDAEHPILPVLVAEIRQDFIHYRGVIRNLSLADKGRAICRSNPYQSR